MIYYNTHISQSSAYLYSLHCILEFSFPFYLILLHKNSLVVWDFSLNFMILMDLKPLCMVPSCRAEMFMQLPLLSVALYYLQNEAQNSGFTTLMMKSLPSSSTSPLTGSSSCTGFSLHCPTLIHLPFHPHVKSEPPAYLYNTSSLRLHETLAKGEKKSSIAASVSLVSSSYPLIFLWVYLQGSP